ncbi:hypothetical protein GCM10010201_06300 [Pilimelia columellifera subsp. columellifera]|uniref:Uncharacterized protein n=1 Tax=Pilimelia columellifera subsp. columellifera TaxID=706583 RepID=A0ABN3N3E5_9ACTN
MPHLITTGARVAVAVAATLVAAAAGSFAGAPAVAGAGLAAVAEAGTKLCAINDERTVELSGLVATASGYVAVNDGSDLEERKRVFLLDRKCKVIDAVPFASEPRDPEDLALSPDGKTLWIADTGDNTADRDRVALWRMPVTGGKRPEIFRLRYPDGARDAEALLIAKDGTPHLITKGAKALIYRAAGPLVKGQETPLVQVGQLDLPRTNTSNPLGMIGRITVTGAASAPDGNRVALRSYADAFEFDVPDGDLVKALTTGRPRVTPLPDEPWGEAISYSPDGARFVTVSETAQSPGVDPVLRAYDQATVLATAPPAAKPAGDERSILSTLSLSDLTTLVSAVGGVGLVLVALGVVGIVRSRRAAAAEPTVPRPAGPARAGRSGAGRKKGQASGTPATRATSTPSPVPPEDAAGVWPSGKAGATGGSAGGRTRGGVYGKPMTAKPDRDVTADGGRR